jgi:hypothetical protein
MKGLRMAKFKIGDKVRIKTNRCGGHWEEGYVGYITSVNDLNYTVDQDKTHWGVYYPEDHIELVEEAMDLTKIEKPFGLLDEATQKALRRYRGPIEHYTFEGWVLARDPGWYRLNTYRVQPKPDKTKIELELTWEELDTIKKVLGRTGL